MSGGPTSAKNRPTSSRGPVGGVSAAARRRHPFNELADGSQLASYGFGQPRRTAAHAAVSRLCLRAVPLTAGGRGRVA